MLSFKVDLGYAITKDGWVVTSDGLPRGHIDEQEWFGQFGHPVRYRRPTPEEAADMKRQDDALARSFAQFREINPDE